MKHASANQIRLAGKKASSEYKKYDDGQIHSNWLGVYSDELHRLMEKKHGKDYWKDTPPNIKESN